LPQSTGAYITSVAAGGPAEKAGIQAGKTPTSMDGLNAGGDLIIAIDGREVMRFDDMISYLYTNKSPGDSVLLTVLRGTERLDFTIILDARP
jgi:2-alkenal reductase